MRSSKAAISLSTSTISTTRSTFCAPHEPQGDGRDDAEQAVAPDGELEQLGIVGAAAFAQLAGGIDRA